MSYDVSLLQVAVLEPAATEPQEGEEGQEMMIVDWDIQPLGEMPDAEIARQLGVTRERVRQVRAERGIPKYEEEEPEWLHLLGTDSDVNIAADHNVARATVNRWRNALGIKPYLRTTRWDEEPLLGKVPDKVLAEKHGVHYVSVARARWDRDIPKYGKLFVDWDTEDRLGKVPDSVLAEEYGLTTSTVGSARIRRGIPRLPGPPSRWDSEPLLGKVPDRVLAKKYGVSAGAVGVARRRRGIPSWRESNRG